MPYPIPPRNLMLTVLAVALAICLTGLMSCASGCNGTAVQDPKRLTVDATETLRDTIHVLNVARRTGDINDAEALAIDPFIDAATAAVDQMRIDALAGNRVGWDTAYRSFNRVMDTLIEHRLKLEQKKPPTPAVSEATILAGLLALAKLLMRLRKEGRTEATDEEMEQARAELGIEVDEWKAVLPK